MYDMDLERGRGTRDQVANICWIIQKAKELQKNTYFRFHDHAKAFDCAFELWCWRRLLRIPSAAERSNQSIIKEINPEHS